MKLNIRPSRLKLISALAVCCFSAVALMGCAAGQQGAEFAHNIQPPKTTYLNYANLPDLLTVMCDEVNLKFKGFYDASLVRVYPFRTLGEFQKNKISELGITMADQMVAVINNNSPKHKTCGWHNTPQQLHGVLQEIDGYLRIRMTAINDRGQRASYVTNVEMSEPIYRALHTYLLTPINGISAVTAGTSHPF
ncbi:MAG: hypothetical protein GXP59_08695 [Deltaproteobacteria bacterium]|nr:hypothetical protein [Deltaproteobacteria bacterium]